MAPKTTCKVCGANKFTLTEGHYYCDVCHGISDMVEIDYDNGVDIRTMINTQRKRKEKIANPKTGKFSEGGVNVEPIKHWTSDRNGDFPIYLKQIGRRLTTFATAVGLWTERMVIDFNVPPSLIDATLYILQKYCSYFGVAFCPTTTTDETEAFTFKWRVTQKMRAQKMKKMVKTRENVVAERTQELEQSMRDDFMSFLTQTQEDHRQQEQSILVDAIEENEIEIFGFEALDSKLKTEVVLMAARLYLEIDLIIAIMFYGCQMVGATWITLSDIARWYREDRLEVTSAQIHALGFSSDVDADKIYDFYKRQRVAQSGSMAMSTYYHPLLVISHICPFESIKTLDFWSIVQRTAYHLNLPHVFVHRLEAILRMIGAPICDIGRDFTDVLCPVQEDAVKRLKISNRIGETTFFDFIFAKSRLPSGLVFMTPEVKAMAVVIFGLKMMFGLDGDREYNMQANGIVADEDEEWQSFVFPKWLIQLRMRLAVWKGMNLKHVLDKKKILESDWFKYKEAQSRKRQKYTRDSDFYGTVPHRPKNGLKDRMFYKIFKADFSRNPRVDISDEALFAPMKAFELDKSQIKDMTEEERQLLDDDKKTLFFEDFSEYLMDYQLDEKVVDRLDAERSTSGEIKKKWLQLFPNMNNYLRYQKPVDVFALAPIADHVYPTIYNSETKQIYEILEDSMVNSFKDLLQMLAHVVGEEVHVLYMTLMMVETMFFDKKKLKELEKQLRSGRPIKLSRCRQLAIDGDDLQNEKGKLRFLLDPGRPEKSDPESAKRRIINNPVSESRQSSSVDVGIEGSTPKRRKLAKKSDHCEVDEEETRDDLLQSSSIDDILNETAVDSIQNSPEDDVAPDEEDDDFLVGEVESVRLSDDVELIRKSRACQRVKLDLDMSLKLFTFHYW